MKKPDKKSYDFAKVDYAIVLFGGLLTACIGALIGMVLGAISVGVPAKPEDIGIEWIIIPSTIGYFVPLVWDIIATRCINKQKHELYASDLVAYNSYLETKQKREFESFIKECKS